MNGLSLMSLREVMRAFDYHLNPCAVGTKFAMSMAFWVQVNGQEGERKVNQQHRVVHVMMLAGPVEFHQRAGFMPIVLWHSAEQAQSYVDIPRWDVIHDRTIDWEVSLDERMDALVASLTRTCRTHQPEGPLYSEVKFFINGVPERITHKGYTMGGDRKSCIVLF